MGIKLLEAPLLNEQFIFCHLALAPLATPAHHVERLTKLSLGSMVALFSAAVRGVSLSNAGFLLS